MQQARASLRHAAFRHSLAWRPRTTEKGTPMLVLHGFWSTSNGLCLWSEDSDLAVKSPSQALRAARQHPFAAPADVIAGIHPGKAGTAVLLLPSCGRRRWTHRS